LHANPGSDTAYSLAGRDVAGQAQTGTGKTAAFLVAMYQALLTRPAPASRNRSSILALIVATDPELAVQIQPRCRDPGTPHRFRQAVVYGGVDYDKQRRQLEDGIDVLIGTPGR